MLQKFIRKKCMLFKCHVPRIFIHFFQKLFNLSFLFKSFIFFLPLFLLRLNVGILFVRKPAFLFLKPALLFQDALFQFNFPFFHSDCVTFLQRISFFFHCLTSGIQFFMFTGLFLHPLLIFQKNLLLHALFFLYFIKPFPCFAVILFLIIIHQSIIIV